MKWNKAQIVKLLEKATEAGVEYELTDEQIAEFFSIAQQPHSDIGNLVKKKIEKAVEDNFNKKAPYRFKVFEKQWPENKAEVYLFSNEEMLFGKNALDSIYVFKGNLFSVPPVSKEFENVLREGVKLFSYRELFGSLVSSKFESMHSDYEVVEMKKANSLEDANLEAPSFLKKWLEKNNKEFLLDADLGFSAEIKISD